MINIILAVFPTASILRWDARVVISRSRAKDWEQPHEWQDFTSRFVLPIPTHPPKNERWSPTALVAHCAVHSKMQKAGGRLGLFTNGSVWKFGSVGAPCDKRTKCFVMTSHVATSWEGKKKNIQCLHLILKSIISRPGISTNVTAQHVNNAITPSPS